MPEISVTARASTSKDIGKDKMYATAEVSYTIDTDKDVKKQIKKCNKAARQSMKAAFRQVEKGIIEQLGEDAFGDD